MMYNGDTDGNLKKLTSTSKNVTFFLLDSSVNLMEAWSMEFVKINKKLF